MGKMEIVSLARIVVKVYALSFHFNSWHGSN